jgi:ribosomal protein L37E
MTQRIQSENWIKCGGCGTEFDLNKNKLGCPLCGFGKNFVSNFSPEIQKERIHSLTYNKHMTIPPEMKLNHADVFSDKETRTWGSWLMFNDFFAPKLITRVLAWKLYEEKSETVLLSSLMNDVINTIKENGLSKLKGFPNLNKDPKGERLVNHFLSTITKMGLTIVKPLDSNVKDIWKEDWEKIRVSLSNKGLEFAQLKNNVLDEGDIKQILNVEEKKWILNYLKEIDVMGYKDYSILKEVYNFLKDGNNGNKDLRNWFINNEKFRIYIPERSKRARESPEVFEKQIWNYARSFSTAKISLLRELGLVRDKRNDYTIMGEFI